MTPAERATASIDREGAAWLLWAINVGAYHELDQLLGNPARCALLSDDVWESLLGPVLAYGDA